MRRLSIRPHNIYLGQLGEDIVAESLKRNGYRVIRGRELVRLAHMLSELYEYPASGCVGGGEVTLDLSGGQICVGGDKCVLEPCRKGPVVRRHELLFTRYAPCAKKCLTDILKDFTRLVNVFITIFRDKGTDYMVDLQHMDLFAVRDDKILAIEVKSGRSTLSAAQERRLILVEKLGIRHVIARVYFPCDVLIEFGGDI